MCWLKIILLALFALILLNAAIVDARSPVYTVEQVVVNGTIEYRFKLDQHHFGSVIDEGGTFAFRPHPGCDVNGWGSTWYAQPFLPGATLKHTIFERIEADADGIRVKALGQVSRNVSETYGDWRITLHFSYDLPARTITAIGQYTITLAAPLSQATGDLNLYKLASNYLDDVPLLSGEIGDTGDMKPLWRKSLVLYGSSGSRHINLPISLPTKPLFSPLTPWGSSTMWIPQDRGTLPSRPLSSRGSKLL